MTSATAAPAEASPRRPASLRAALVRRWPTALAAVAADPDAARYVLAACWLSHAAWDVAHHRLGRVVPRWYAETCMVADLVLAAALLTVGLG